MRGIYVGIDVGGTHTDGVAVEGERLLSKAKVPTGPDLRACTLAALEALLQEVSTPEVRRVVLSTTLVTNAVVEGTLEPTGATLTAGPGLSPELLVFDEHTRVVPGALDHRGREIAPLDEGAVRDHLDRLAEAGVRVLAVAGKFSVRNPAHELRIAELAAARGFEHVALGHVLAGALNFPRRAATAYLAAGVWRRHAGFVRAMGEALRGFGITAPLYLLRADGGTQFAASFRNPAEAALSGPAASVMGVEALASVREETLALDVGGTTTDVSLFVRGAPLLEPHGATVGPYRTQIRALYTRSTGAGGDSVVAVEDGEIRVGPRREGPPAAHGGPCPTPTDAMVVLGRALGDVARAGQALAPVARALGLGVEAAAREVLQAFAATVARAAREFVDTVNARPVYTIHELLEGHRARPTRAVVVGGPARAIAPYVEQALDLPVYVPNHFDVANAVGAALARVNLEVNLVADTAAGRLSIPEAGVHRTVGRDYGLQAARDDAARALMDLAKVHGMLGRPAAVDFAEEEEFRIIEGFRTAGSIYRIRAQIRPGILGKVE
ncbi:MAG: hydantoinase/oxoprolinase family protein [Deferrisomatales bacterium]